VSIVATATTYKQLPVKQRVFAQFAVLFTVRIRGADNIKRYRGEIVEVLNPCLVCRCLNIRCSWLVVW
jgi:hypothetical protein